MIYSLTNVLGSTIAGILFDHHDARKMMLGGIIAAILIMIILIFFNSWPAYPIFLTLFGFFNGWIITILNSFASVISSGDSRLVFNKLYFTNNLGLVFGTMIVGPLYQFSGNSVAPMFLITIIMYLFYSAIVQQYFVFSPKSRTQKDVKNTADKISVPTANRYVIGTLFLSISIIWITYSQWSSNLSVYITGQRIPMSLYSLLWTINGLLILVFQVMINQVTKKVANDYWFIYVGILACGLSFIILIFSHTYFCFVLGMAMLTFGEATAFPTIPAVINALTPEESKGRYQGFLNAFMSLGKALGPLSGGLVIESLSYRGLFLACLITLGIVESVIVFVSLITKHLVQTF